MSDPQPFPRNRNKSSDTFNNSYTTNKLNHPINLTHYDAAKYHNLSQNNPLTQSSDNNDYKSNSYLNNRQDIYPDQTSILNNTYNQNANYYDEFNNHQSDHKNSQNYSDYPFRSEINAIKSWDVFALSPPAEDDETLDSNIYKLFIKFLKVCAYLITFGIVLSCSIISKSSLLFMTSLIKPNKTGISVCSQGIPGLDRDKKYESIFQLNDPERVAWIWSLLFVLNLPEILTLFRSIRICTFKSFKRPKPLVFCTVFIMESFHTIGLVIFVFAVLPELNVIKGAMLTNCLCLVPGILALLSRNSDEESMYLLKIMADIFAVLGQISAFIYWIMIDTESSNLKFSLPISCVLISCGWWENYCEDNSPIAFVRVLAEMKECLNRSRYITYIIVSSWKIVLLIFGTFIVRLKIDGSSLYLLTQFRNAFSQHKVLVARDRGEVNFLSENNDGIEGEWLELDVFSTNALKFILIQIASTWLTYIFGKFACKICIQGFSFTLALVLTVPITIVLFTASCDAHLTDNCALNSILPRHLFWTCPNDSNINYDSFMSIDHTLWIIWILSQIWICLHICKPKCERLATTEKLFVNPMYCSAFIDQSMMLNRRRNDLFVLKFEHLNLDKDDQRRDFGSETQHYETISEPTDEKKQSPVKKEDYTTTILVCATMWHETKEEMIQMLKSVFRMDEDQCAKKNAKKFINEKVQDYYEFEVNIFFDDAFEYAENSDEMEVNRFVKMFFTVLDEAASNVHQTEIRIKPPKKYTTPYGGRLEWTLPGSNKLIVHLKDKLKIRHRKRWSQVMYMYYLLGHRLMELPIEVSRKSVKAENTYILALDGDINFRPSAVQLLVDLMKKNRKLGAACGRIHPVGSGPMVWYQKFEYAIGHWLQKATEHMIGCVLCSPGCFSLFRAKALMDDNVMRKYATKAEEALHYVQYDQGEDRWLCTLLLQRGYRVEYSAASDAYTHCPEGFGEFFTQRRRWAPSTMANIMDLLGDYKRTVAINDNISLPYIIYQGMLMVGTVLGPGTIFLMLVGALVAVFRISNWYSFQLNLVPILIFMLICFTMKNDYQILAAQFLSACYALLMMAVFVGTSIQMTEDGISSPSAMFFLALTGTFFVAAMLHPQEFGCVVPIILYFLSIPSMYLLLIVYSLINLNVVTWGTREITPRSPVKKISQEEEKKAHEALKKKSLLNYFNQNLKDEEEEGGIVFSLANLFKCMFFTHPKPNEEKMHLIKIEDSLQSIQKKLKGIEKSVVNHRRRLSSSMSNTNKTRSLEALNENPENDDLMSDDSMRLNNEDDTDLSFNVNKIERDDMVNPHWIEDKDLLNGEMSSLSENEINFFNDLIAKYLYPLDANKQEQAKIASDLIELRNRVVFAFLMVNALFILIVFLLQLNKDILHVQWPFGVRENITFIPETNEIRVEKHYLEMEPIGLVFVMFFGTILVIQFVGMLFHRFATLSHILASVELFETKKPLSSETELTDAAAIALRFQRLKGINNDDKSSTNHDPGGRNIVERCEERKFKKKQNISTLDVAFRKRFEEFTKNPNEFQDIPSTPILGLRNSETLKELKKKGNFLLLNNEQNRNGTLDRNICQEFTRTAKNRSTLDKKNTRKNGVKGASFASSSGATNRLENVFTNPVFNRVLSKDDDLDAISMSAMNFNDPNDRRNQIKQQFNSEI